MAVHQCVIVSLLSVILYGSHASVPMTKVHDWSGNFEGHFIFHAAELIDGWELVIHFSHPVNSIQQYVGVVKQTSPDKTMYLLINNRDNGITQAGETLDIKVQGMFSGSTTPTATATLINLAKDGQTLPPIIHSVGTKYDYDDVITKSILFYEAQRSGKLPANNRISWRRDSALNDSGLNRESLTGGWYDAGDNVKFGFPMSASVTLLAWSLLEYKDAYEHAGELENMYSCIRWPLEWLVKAHTAPNELYVQVGDGGKDHGVWTRPEDLTMDRPAFKIDTTKPGSDIAAEYAAAMAAGYLVFKDKDSAFASTLLQHARQLYDFALQHRGLYSNSVNAAAAYYRSSDDEDELTWGGAWLYRATGEQKYLTEAEKHYETGAAWGQSWDEKNTGNMILLYNATNKPQYLQDIEATFTDWMPGGSIPYSPEGLAFRSEWGSLRYASNMAFMALLAADQGIHSSEYRSWAKGQIHYALGDTGRSFVVGFGHNPPTRPHHRASSCPSIPAPCSWADQQQKGPNPHVLYGALVGGPDGSDNYEDSRLNYVNNEVACDYNAGFQGAVAGLESLSLHGSLP